MSRSTPRCIAHSLYQLYSLVTPSPCIVVSCMLVPNSLWQRLLQKHAAADMGPVNPLA